MATASRILFLASGLLWLLIGVLTPLLSGRGVAPTFIFLSPTTDQALFGAPPDEVLATNPQLMTFRGIAIRTLAGMLVAAGVLTAGVAWFGLREASIWALATLTVVGLAVLPYWWIALQPYRAAGISYGLGDIPPLMWVPAILMPLGAVLGWLSATRG